MPHLDLDALADLLAGEGAAADVAHLEGCAACSGRLAELDDAVGPVSALLAQEAARPLPAPPADLEAVLQRRLREDAAAPPHLADDPTAPSATAGAAPPGASARAAGPGDVVPLRPRAASSRSGLLGAAAAGVALLALAGLGLGVSRAGGGGSDAGSSAPGGDTAAEGAPFGEVATSSTGTDYRRDGRALAAALPGLLGAAAGGSSSGEDSTARKGTGATGGDGSTAGGGPTGDGTAGGGTAGGTAGAPAPAAGRSGRTPAPEAQDSALGQAAPADPLARLRDPAALAGCLAELSGPDTDGVPLALDYAAFEGQPALLVVLPSAREGKVDVFAVGAGCTAGDDQTLFFSRLDRP